MRFRKGFGYAKEFLKLFVSGSQGQGKPESKDCAPLERSPSESGAQVDRLANREMVTKGVFSEESVLENQASNISKVRQAQSDIKGNDQSFPFDDKASQHRPTGQSEPAIYTTLSAPINDTADKAERKSEPQTEDRKNITQAYPQSQQKFIFTTCALDPKIRHNIESGNMTGCYFCNTNAKIRKLSNIVKKGKDEINSLQNTVKDKENRIESLEKSLGKKEEEAKNLTRQVQAQQHEIESLYTKCEDFKANFEKNETEIRKLQQTESAMRKQGNVLMDEDARSLILDIIQTKVKTISHIYLKYVPWANILRASDDQGLSDIFSGVFYPAWQLKHWSLVRAHTNISTQTVVKALLSSTISKLFFENPFFCYGEARKQLHDLYQLAIEKDPNSAVVWRVKTVSLLNQISYGKDSTASVSHYLVLRIMDSIKKLLMIDHSIKGGELNGLYEKLVDLVQSSVKLAADWHSREFYFRVINIDWLYWMGFKAYSAEAARYVTPYPMSQKLENGKSYNILAVISPGFIRYIKGDDETEFQEIIWEKASVLLTEKPLL
ncbi:hypothetical protein TWF730_011299 [Orbilia blumenaviensis]|uniref:Uncharacterized protein n=1 Tax=Orbilia blumenaviensis TaxID=1796055 RepID=A0AAV9UM99_9PEZI